MQQSGQLFLLRRRSPDGGRPSDHRPAGQRLPLLRRPGRSDDAAGRDGLSPPGGRAGRGGRSSVGPLAVGSWRVRDDGGPGRQRRHRRAGFRDLLVQRRLGRPYRAGGRPLGQLALRPGRHGEEDRRAEPQSELQRRELRPGRLWRLALGRRLRQCGGRRGARQYRRHRTHHQSGADRPHGRDPRSQHRRASAGRDVVRHGRLRPVAPRGPGLCLQRRRRLCRTGRRRPVPVRRPHGEGSDRRSLPARRGRDGRFQPVRRGRLSRRPGRQFRTRSASASTTTRPRFSHGKSTIRSAVSSWPRPGSRATWGRSRSPSAIAAGSAITPTAIWAASSCACRCKEDKRGGGLQRPFFRTHMAASASVSQTSGSV